LLRGSREFCRALTGLIPEHDERETELSVFILEILELERRCMPCSLFRRRSSGPWALLVKFCRGQSCDSARVSPTISPWLKAFHPCLENMLLCIEGDATKALENFREGPAKSLVAASSAANAVAFKHIPRRCLEIGRWRVKAAMAGGQALWALWLHGFMASFIMLSARTVRAVE
jgi:hypothetical protein